MFNTRMLNLGYTTSDIVFFLTEVAEELRTSEVKFLKKDIYIDEALNVLNELTIKPDYHLVKN